MISVAIAHAGFLPERKKSLARLLEQLKAAGCTAPFVSVSKEKEHARVWAMRVWKWAAQQKPGTPVVILNDDIEVHPKFAAVLEAMVKAVPGKVLALHPQNPATEGLAKANYNWFRCYWLTGPAYLAYPAQYEQWIKFGEKKENEVLWKGNEDNVVIHYSWSQQAPQYTCIPAIVKHDVEVPSTLGYDNHPNRVATVLWNDERFKEKDLTDPAYWKPLVDPPFVENPWATSKMLEQFRKGIQPCSFCLANPACAGSPKTGAKVCRPCLAEMVKQLLLEHP